MRFLPDIIYLEPGARLALYFVLGGTITTLAIYLGGSGRGTLAAFLATLPFLTAVTFFFIDAEGGTGAVKEYARGLLIFLPPWICYVVTVMLGTQRLGIGKSLGIGFLVYIVLSYFFKNL